MLKIVDLGNVGNIGSVVKAIDFLRVSYEIIREPAQLKGASKLILPGVGNFKAASGRLRDSGFLEGIREAVHDNNTPILGVCVGMQLLASYGEEGGGSEGFGFIDADVVKLNNFDGKLNIPHMGWNDVNTGKLAVFSDIDNLSCFYFVHSYAMRIKGFDGVSVATTNYGEEIVAYVNKGNVHGVQFHPEKSQHIGLKLLRNFIELC